MAGAGEGYERWQRAFRRAVEREREAIELHEQAAQMHESTAALLDRSAVKESDPGRRAELSQQAATERELARAALGRARTAQERLTAEGADDLE